MNARAPLLVALLAGCGPPSAPSGPPPTTTGTTAGTPAGSPTGPTTPPYTSPLCVTYQDVSRANLLDAWVAADGTLHAVGETPSPRARAADGTWSLDVGAWSGAHAVDGAGTQAWALGEGVARRDPSGAWVDLAAPMGAHEGVALHVRGPDDVVVLVSPEDSTTWDCYTSTSTGSCAWNAYASTPVVLSWDGVAWTQTTHPEVLGPLTDLDVLPDGTQLLTAGGQVSTLGPGGSIVPTPPGQEVFEVVVGADGSIVTLGGDMVGLGDRYGVAANPPPVPEVAVWTGAWASSATDVWVAGRWTDATQHAAIAHWDGLAWDVVEPDLGVGDLRLAGGGGRVFAVGDSVHEVVLVGDTGGFALDREAWHLGHVDAIAVDDVTDEAWTTGEPGVLGRWDGAAWESVMLPDPTLRSPDLLAASDGRVLIVGETDLHVFAGGALSTTPALGHRFYAVAASEGALFAAVYDGDDASPPVVWRESGAGWEALDTSALPVGAKVSRAWADAADDLWLGIGLPGGAGAVARWAGGAWSVPITGLGSSPDWMARLPDGDLYVQFGPNPEQVFVWDGATASPATGLPDGTRAAWTLPDGTWVVSARVVVGDDGYGAILHGAPGGAWTELLVDDYVFTLGGSSDRVWAARWSDTWALEACGG